MLPRWKTAIVLILLAAGSGWLLNKLSGSGVSKQAQYAHNPDYYMENFITTTMEQDGSLKNKLYADYMAHYPDDDTTELDNPKLEVFRNDGAPVMIIADKGWVTSDNKVILLTGNVTLWRDNKNGGKKMEIVTTDVKVLTEQEYAETDQPATLVSDRTTINATGVRAYFKENRVELLNNVHTKIQPEATD